MDTTSGCGGSYYPVWLNIKYSNSQLGGWFVLRWEGRGVDSQVQMAIEIQASDYGITNKWLVVVTSGRIAGGLSVIGVG